jgi:dTDP-4-amino-4,6-dideoxygalactose transaminase
MRNGIVPGNPAVAWAAHDEPPVSELAILGGKPLIEAPLRPYPSMGVAEERALLEVVRSGELSGFYASPGDRFLGGPKVRALEDAWCERYDVAQAVSMNSATSGLIAAMGAVGIAPGDEVIVPPWTMSASVVAPLFYGGIPVFADIEEETFCIDPAAVRDRITPRTRAIVAVNLFGHPARLAELRALADENGIALVEDNAQAPLAAEGEQMAGTVGHIGVFSLNFHKHIHAGEGGVCVTGDAGLARRLRLIRNHGENVVEEWGETDISNMIGFNFRLTELGAAVALAQLASIDEHVGRRERLARTLSEATADLDGWLPPTVRQGCRHVYYAWVARLIPEKAGVARAAFARALAAEGFPIAEGYVPPLYNLPLFRQRLAFGGDGYPFSLGAPDYAPGICPVAERLQHSQALLFECCLHDIDQELAGRLAQAVVKVHRHRDELRRLPEKD